MIQDAGWKRVPFSLPEANIFAEWDELNINEFTFSFTDSLSIFTNISINENISILQKTIKKIREIIPKEIEFSKTWYHSGIKYEKTKLFRYPINVGLPFNGKVVFHVECSKKEYEYLKENIIKENYGRSTRRI